MSTPQQRRRTAALAVKSLVFTVVTVLATVVLAATIRNGSGAGAEYRADFTDVTSLNKGDDIRMAGVKVGAVRAIEVGDDGEARVTFTVNDEVRVPAGTTLELRFRNLVGQRYIALQPPTTPVQAPAIAAGHTFGTDATAPALDLTLLFNGFQPLFRLLDPQDVNALSGQILAVFQGDGASVDELLASTGRLTTTLARKDAVIGDLVTSLSSVLDTVERRTDQVDTTILTLQRLVSGLADDRESIGASLEGLGDLSASVADLLEEGRAPLRDSIDGLGGLAGNLADSEETLDEVLGNLPTKLDALGRVNGYGSWINLYACSVQGLIPMPEGYTGDLGVEPIAGRCRA